jgi:hypothetical protein
MSTNPNLITLLKIASTINLKVAISTNFIFTQPPWERGRGRGRYFKEISSKRVNKFQDGTDKGQRTKDRQYSIVLKIILSD